MNGYKVLLFLTLFGVGIALYVAIGFGQKLDQELAQINKLAQQNHELSVQLTHEQDALQQSNDQQTIYLQCLLASQNLGIFPGNCNSPAVSNQINQGVKGGAASNQSSSQSHPDSSSGDSSSHPVANTVSGVVQALIHAIGL